MKVFLSWSGSASRQVAACLKDWLPNALQFVEPWMSEEDIDRGARWADAIEVQLAATNFGVICVTPQNQAAPWLNFEAGALAKKVEDNRVCPYVLGMKKGEIKGPLGIFNAAVALDRSDNLRLLQTINRAAVTPLVESRLNASFDRWWPDLEERLGSVELGDSVQSRPDPDAMLEEILLSVRRLERDVLSHTHATAFGPSGTVIQTGNQAGFGTGPFGSASFGSGGGEVTSHLAGSHGKGY